MNTPDTREWLLTNGLGGFASGTVCDARTRTYHGWLVAALDPPGRRTLLLSHLEASLEVNGRVFALGTNVWTGGKVDPWGYRLLQSFQVDPVPTWQWGTDEWQLSRRIVMPDGWGGELCQRVLVEYCYTGQESALLRLRPIIGDRDFHHVQKESSGLTFSQIINSRRVLLQAHHQGTPGTPWQLRWSHGRYHPDEVWYWSYYYLEEAQRGLDHLEDLYSPGYLTTLLQPGEKLTLEARLGFPSEALPELSPADFDNVIRDQHQRFDHQVTTRQIHQISGSSSPGSSLQREIWLAGDRFLVHPTAPDDCRILAGYHWYGDRTRDTILCIPGLLLTPHRFGAARKLLNQIGRSCYQGLLPESLPNAATSPLYQNADCSLWWLETLGLYLDASQDWEFLREQYDLVKHIYKAFTVGTLHNIQIDASDGLITWDEAIVPLTWMNTMVNGQAVTLRNGKPVEINALWYSVLCWASQWATKLGANPESSSSDPLSNQARRYAQQAEQVKASLQKFWNPRQRYLFDRIELSDRFDPTLRPNAVLALSLHHCVFTDDQARQILAIARDRLLTPYGLRTLDPQNPAYVERYIGNPYQRDLASHQGTVWSWLLGPFIRAWQRFHPDAPLPLEMQPIIEHFHHQVCFAAISELFDGNAPHAPGGAVASALAMAELIRCGQQW